MLVSLWEGGSAPARFDLHNDAWRPPEGLAVGDTIEADNGVSAMVLWRDDRWCVCWGVDCGDAPFAMDADGVCHAVEVLDDDHGWLSVNCLGDIRASLPTANYRIGELLDADRLRPVGCDW